MNTASPTSHRAWAAIDYRPAVPDHFPEALLAHLSLGARVLDVGCGTGSVARYLSRHGFRVEGVDLNRAAIESAGQCEVCDHGRSPIFHHCDFLEFQSGDAFDAITMIRFLTCIPEGAAWRACLDKARSLAATSGVLYVHDFLMAPESTAYRDRYADGTSRGWRAGNFAVHDSAGRPIFIAHHHTPAEIVEIRTGWSELLFSEHDSVSMNGNPCRMFEFLGTIHPNS
jgi:SAM-dependent methyltransferase